MTVLPKPQNRVTMEPSNLEIYTLTLQAVGAGVGNPMLQCVNGAFCC